MAVNCSVVPIVRPGLAGVTAMDTSVAEVTVRIVEPEMLSNVAVIAVVPAPTAVAFPLVATIVAAVVSDEVHVADAVIS